MLLLITFIVLTASEVQGSVIHSNQPGNKAYDGHEADLSGVLHKGIISPYAALHSAAERSVVSSLGNVSTICSQQMQIMLLSVLGMQPWALEVLDAIGKPEAGLLRGSLYWMGQYDQCLAITFPEEYDMIGQASYCYAMFLPPFTPSASLQIGPDDVEIRWDFCLPPACDAHDLVYIIQNIEVLIHEQIPIIDISLNVTKTDCITPAPTSIAGDHTAIIVTIILLVIALLLLGGTVLDIGDAFMSPTVMSEAPEDGNKADLEKNSPTTHGHEDERIHGVEDDTEFSKESATEFSATESSTKESITKGSTKESRGNLKETDYLLPKERPSKRRPSSRSGLGVVIMLFRAFSIPTNLGNMLSTDHSPGTIACLHGIRVISMGYVILGNIFAAAFASVNFINVSNGADVLDALYTWPFQAVINAGVSVDSFFFLSGLLVAYVFLNEMRKRNNKVSGSMFGWYYFHRWWRLTPLYGFVLMVVIAYFKYLKNGPLWAKEVSEATSCADIWWRNLLYINNLFHNDQQCLSYTWFLANVMQFHVISPAILIPLAIKPILGFIGIGVLIVVHVVTTVAIMVHYDGGGPIPTRTTMGYADYVYIKPYSRIGVYCVGMVIGYILMKHKRIRLNKLIVVLGWCFALASIPLVSYLSWSEMQPDAESWGLAARCVWEPVRRHLWALALGWIVLACHNGYGGCIDTLLSWRFWTPLSRMTYATFLFHPIVLMIWSFMERNQFYYNILNMIFLYTGMLVVSYVGAGFTSLVLEWPFISLERLFIKHRQGHTLSKEKL